MKRTNHSFSQFARFCFVLFLDRKGFPSPFRYCLVEAKDDDDDEEDEAEEVAKVDLPQVSMVI